MKSTHRINAESTSSRQQSSRCRNRDQYENATGITRRIKIADAEKYLAQELRDASGGYRSNKSPSKHWYQELFENYREHMQRFCSQCNANGDLLGPLGDRVRNQPNDSNAGQQHCHHSQYADSDCGVFQNFRKLTEAGLEQPDIWKQFRIERFHNRLHHAWQLIRSASSFDKQGHRSQVRRLHRPIRFHCVTIVQRFDARISRHAYDEILLVSELLSQRFLSRP